MNKRTREVAAQLELGNLRQPGVDWSTPLSNEHYDHGKETHDVIALGLECRNVGERQELVPLEEQERRVRLSAATRPVTTAGQRRTRLSSRSIFLPSSRS